MQIALCDDSLDDLKVVERIVKHRFMQFPELEVKAYQCAEDMLEDFVNTKPFACILDIEMPGIDGLQLAEKISKCYPRTYLVFCSKRDELVFQAIHRQPISFVRKKYLEAELSETMDLLLKHYHTDYKLYRIPRTGEMVMLKDIIYFESCQHNIILQTVDKRIEFRCKISEIARQLEGEGFMRIHKGFIVNVRFIARLAFGKITLESGQELPVSRSYYENVKRQYLLEMEKIIYG